MDLKTNIKQLLGKLTKPKIKPDSQTSIPKYTEEEVKLMMDVQRFNESRISPAAEALANHFQNLYSMYLDNKIDKFIEWYIQNMIKGKYPSVQEHHFETELRDFIEKMAVWYELRYPSYEINRLMNCEGQEFTKVSEVMFDKNQYINGFFDEESEVRIIDWDEFYNPETFIESLPWTERTFLSTPKYTSPIYLKHIAHFHLSPDGIVVESENLDIYTIFDVLDEDIVGMHIKDVLSLLKQKNIELPEDNEIEKAIKSYEERKYFKEELLNCVMYRIIERGRAKIGPRRGFIFALEFGRNIDIPMMYGVEYTDVGLRDFINTYLKSGGSPDLECYINYFSTSATNKKLETISVRDILKFKNDNAVNHYTEEEINLQQNLVNVLSNQINPKTLQKEQIKARRIQRKLERARARKHNGK